MNAVAIPRYRRIKQMIKDDVRHGADLRDYMLEPDECVTFIEEEETNWDQSVAVAMNLHEAVAELATTPGKLKTFERFDKLCRKLMQGTMSVEELCEWRDIQRAALIDHVSALARREVEQEMPA